VTDYTGFLEDRPRKHRHTIREKLVELFVTPGATEHSTAMFELEFANRLERY